MIHITLLFLVNSARPLLSGNQTQIDHNRSVSNFTLSPIGHNQVAYHIGKGCDNSTSKGISLFFKVQSYLRRVLRSHFDSEYEYTEWCYQGNRIFFQCIGTKDGAIGNVYGYLYISKRSEHPALMSIAVTDVFYCCDNRGGTTVWRSYTEIRFTRILGGWNIHNAVMKFDYLTGAWKPQMCIRLVRVFLMDKLPQPVYPLTGPLNPKDPFRIPHILRQHPRVLHETFPRLGSDTSPGIVPEPGSEDKHRDVVTSASVNVTGDDSTSSEENNVSKFYTQLIEPNWIHHNGGWLDEHITNMARGEITSVYRQNFTLLKSRNPKYNKSSGLHISSTTETYDDNDNSSDSGKRDYSVNYNITNHTADLSSYNDGIVYETGVANPWKDSERSNVTDIYINQLLNITFIDPMVNFMNTKKLLNVINLNGSSEIPARKKRGHKEDNNSKEKQIIDANVSDVHDENTKTEHNDKFKKDNAGKNINEEFIEYISPKNVTMTFIEKVKRYFHTIKYMWENNPIIKRPQVKTFLTVLGYIILGTLVIIFIWGTAKIIRNSKKKYEYNELLDF